LDIAVLQGLKQLSSSKACLVMVKYVGASWRKNSGAHGI